ncbi:MAG: formylglycine-generating enzyme family protein [Nitrospirota bacterium]
MLAISMSPAGIASAEPVCSRCHTDGRELKADDRHDPACRECHLPDDGVLPAKAGASTIAAPAPAQAEPIVTQRMVRVPAGAFWMGNNGRGADGPGDEDEQPLHRVTVDTFWIDVYETTNAMYKAFVDAMGQKPPKHWQNDVYPPGKANHPVIYISWHEAKSFCEWAGKRLPTEQEWEKAARGTDKRVFPWGNEIDMMKANTPQRWLALNQKGDTMPVGSFEAGQSPYGLYDMSGNVYEWVADWYLPYPGNQYPNQHYGNKNKIVRGGSWYDCLSYGCGLSAPTYNRSRFNPDIRNKGFGFRCAKSADGKSPVSQ